MASTPRPRPASTDLPAGTGPRNPQADAYVNQLAQPGDRILRMRGGGDLAIYESVLSDPQVASCFLQRRNAVTAREWIVEAASERRADKKAADHLRLQLQRIGFDNVTEKMLYGVFYGYSAAEILWDVQDGLLGWSAIKVRNRRKFRFGAGGELRRFAPSDPVNGAQALPPYFWHFATGADNDDEPYGLGLAHWCYWPVLFKRQGLKAWLIFLDKFGMPTVVGKFGAGATTEEKNRLLQVTQAIATDTGVIIPDGMLVELLEAARAGAADYNQLHQVMNETIAKAIIGQTASSQGTPGKLGNDELQGDVRMDIVKADADLVCESLNRGPVKWLTEHNFDGADPPRVFRVVQEPEDANTVAERDAKVFAMGFKPGLEYIHEQYGDHWEAKAETDPAAPKLGPDGKPLPPKPGDQPGEFAEGAEASLQDTIAATLGREAAQHVGGWLQRLERAVEESADFDVFNDRLLREFSDLPTEALSSLVGSALVTAELGARAQVIDEVGSGDGDA